MEIVPDDISPVELREEVNSRTHRAGYSTRSGGPIPLKIISMPLSEQGRRNYDMIFNKEK